uniref:Putative secreted metalloprotease n=1 Tax=Ixodes ricinus TaxID=34613 RepID=A0A147BVX9_IXORI
MEKLLLCTLLFRASRHFLATVTDARTVQYLKVFPAILRERSLTNNISMRIHDHLMLNLERSSVFSDKFQFIAHTDISKITYYINASDVEQNLYHDTERDAAIMITDDNDGLRVEGVLGDTLRIRPSSVVERNAEGHVAHELFEVSLRHLGGDDTVSVETRDAGTSQGRTITPLLERSDSGFLLTVSPEVHVVIDSAFTKHFKLRSKLLQYLAIFIAAVNLKYRTLSFVDLQLVVTKVTIFHNVSEPFITRSEHHPTIMMGETLWNFSTYVGRTDDFKNDDMVVLLTGMDIGYVNLTSNKSYGLGISGLANLGGACGLWTRGALVEDVPKTFSGVVTFAHECGHLLGIAHDGSPPQTYVKNNVGAEGCPASERYIMSPSMGATSIYKFSYCSAQQLYTFVGDPSRECLRNSPSRHSARVSLQRWNKTLVSPVEFCKLEYPDRSILGYVEELPGLQPAFGMATCHIVCEVPKNGFVISNAPDGMPCDKTDSKKVCINKDCVEFPTNITTLTKKPRDPKKSD